MQALADFTEEFNELHKCSLCNLEVNRVRIFGGGKLNSLCFIGLAPTFFRRGKGNIAFTDEILGKMLDEMLKKINLSREEVYMTNILKESTLNNIVPDDEVVDAHFSFLTKELGLVNPNLIVLMGNDVNRIFTEHGASIGFSGNVASFNATKCVKIMHPSFVKRSRLYKEYFKEFETIQTILVQRDYWKRILG